LRGERLDFKRKRKKKKLKKTKEEETEKQKQKQKASSENHTTEAKGLLKKAKETKVSKAKKGRKEHRNTHPQLRCPLRAHAKRIGHLWRAGGVWYREEEFQSDFEAEGGEGVGC
jgi:hypothetical protein